MTLTTTFSEVSNGHNFTKEQTTDHKPQHNYNTGTQSNLDSDPADVWMYSHKPQHNYNTGTQSNLDPDPADVWMYSHKPQHNHNTGTQSNLDPDPADVWMYSHKPQQYHNTGTQSNLDPQGIASLISRIIFYCDNFLTAFYNRSITVKKRH
jgi:hypothetical protein